MKRMFWFFFFLVFFLVVATALAAMLGRSEDFNCLCCRRCKKINNKIPMILMKSLSSLSPKRL